EAGGTCQWARSCTRATRASRPPPPFYDDGPLWGHSEHDSEWKGRRGYEVNPFHVPLTSTAVTDCLPRAPRIWCSRDAAKATTRDGHSRGTRRRDVSGRPSSALLGGGGRSPPHSGERERSLHECP